MVSKFINSLKYIKVKDIVAIFIFILVLIPALIYKLYLRLRKRDLYLICEAPNEARDNGYHLFKYVRVNYPNDNVYYAINKKSNDYLKIKDLGNVIQFGSLKHWVYYLAATKNISTHKYGNPNAPLFYVVHVILGLFNNRIFLQHGITMNNSPWLYYKNTKFSKVICGAKPEYEYMKNNFGYDKDKLEYLGFPRFDNLNEKTINEKQIVIMPTWRNWLGRETNKLNKNESFINTEYYNRYNDLINNKKFIKFLEQEKIILYFFPHRNMQQFINEFKSISKNVKIVSNDDVDIQTLIIESALMITDYSSVSMDFAYMKKPVVYYQFDAEEYRKRQLQEGYFSYVNDGFGPVITEEEKLIDYIISNYNGKFNLENKYFKRINNFFEINDTNNCKRVYNMIKE